jgi:hypothetical protein
MVLCNDPGGPPESRRRTKATALSASKPAARGILGRGRPSFPRVLPNGSDSPTLGTMLRLNIEEMPPETLRRYFAYLISFSADPMTSADREDYRQWRSRVAMRLAFFPRQ